jgi:hypothetical protein
MLTPVTVSREIDGINQLRRVLEQLDGQVDVLLRVDKKFVHQEAMTRLFYKKKSVIKTRPMDADDELGLVSLMREIRTRRQKHNKTHDFLVYVLRSTFVITDDLPTMEASVFKIGPSPDYKLDQYGVNAWVSVFEPTKTDTLVKVAYIEPSDFSKDLGGFDLLQATMPEPEKDSVYTCWIATVDTGMNFDVENSVMTTMHIDMMNACLSIMFASKKDIYIIWRTNKENKQNMQNTGFMMDGKDQDHKLVTLTSAEIKQARNKLNMKF